MLLFWRHPHLKRDEDMATLRANLERPLPRLYKFHWCPEHLFCWLCLSTDGYTLPLAFSGLTLIWTLASLSLRSFSSWPAFVLKMPQLVLQPHQT